MSRPKVTAKFQVIIPKEVREKVEVRPGEVVSVEALSPDEIVVRRYPRTNDPLKTLVGKIPAPRRVPVEELERLMESK